MATATALAGAGSQVLQARARLDLAISSRRPCPPVRDLLPPGDLDAAYAVQTSWVAQQLATGGRVVGRKIGLTSLTVQAQLGVDQPDFGFLLVDMACTPEETIDMGRLLQPRIEAEMAFIIGTELVPAASGGAVTRQQVDAAITHVVPALEIVDSRIAGWDITLVDTVADNASAGLFVLGNKLQSFDPELDLARCAMTMWRGREDVSSGAGSDCLGHPLNAVSWLATKAAGLGEPLQPGDIVLSGALGPMVAVAAGDIFTAEIAGLGSVTAHFGGAA